MKIILNSKEEFVDRERLTVSDLLNLKNFNFKMMVVKLNGQLIKRNEYGETLINDGDDVMVLQLVSGG
ncbi:MAG TPA: sulfur carrier protein ThiS [Bacteroidales bacterium]|jgi:thiamine biosynthesis protein ThiS|nr:sulfur carrier protein ThiS [Bacteroidales bacterium]